jgi:VWFA-related protein
LITSDTVIKKESKQVLVDVIVTDKKGKYVRDLAQGDFKVYEDNKEQALISFSAGTSQTPGPNSNQKHYLVLFFDNSSMEMPDQMSARRAATQFIDANAGANNLMAVVEFGGALRILQNFTASADLLKRAASGVKGSSVASNAGVSAGGAGVISDSGAMSSISAAEADYGARTMLLALRSLAKNLRTIPGRKMVVLISAGFPLSPERQSELTATLDACMKANVAIYALDARGLLAGSLRNTNRGLRNATAEKAREAASTPRDKKIAAPRLVLAAFPEPQRPGGGGGTGGGGGRPGGGTGGTGGTGGRGGTGGTGGTGGRGGTGGTGGTGGRGGTGGTGGTGGRGGTGTTGGGGGTRPTAFNNPNNPLSQPRTIVPQLPVSAVPNQQILAALAEGTGGFTIFNTNDLLGGLQRIASEQNEFYLLGYVPADSPEGSCHTLKVKLNHGGGMNVRSRTGYCNARSANVLEGTPVEKQLELRAHDTGAAASAAPAQVPYFYSGANVARVNLAMDIPGESFHFDKDKGKYHANLSVLGIAYKPDGTVGAKFSDQVKLDLEKDEWKEFSKGPYHYMNQFDAAPGFYKMTVVLNSGGEAFTKSEWPLKIEDYDGQHLSLGSVVISNAAQRVEAIATSADLDAVLLEDRTPLVVKGMEIKPVATNRFKKTDNVIMYSEIYEPLLVGENPPKVVFGYNLLDRATNQQIMSTGSVSAEDFIHKGSPVVPVGLLVKVSDLKPGQYRLVLMAIDGAGRQATNRTADFDVTD